MRFYDSDGIEIDVQDLNFYIDKKELIEQQEAIEELLNYAESI